MKIAMVFDGLGIGGIERVGVDYLRLFNQEGYQIDVYNLNPEAREMENEIDDSVRIFHYRLSRRVCPYIYSVAKRKWWWGKYLYPFAYAVFSVYQEINKRKIDFREEYDIAIAFSGHFNDLTFVAENYLRAKKKVCWLHGSVSDYLELAEGYGKLYRKIKNLVVLASSENPLEKSTELNVEKIYNPSYVLKRKVDEEKVKQLRDTYGEYLLMVGRFTKEKDQKTVLEAVKILKEKYKIEKKVLFLGDGPEKKTVEEYAEKLNLGRQAEFMGNCFDVQNYYKAAYIAVHSSPAEGLPTVVLEAMAYGVPVVATDSRPGVPEILGTNNQYGLVCDVKNAEEMAQNLYKLISDKEIYKSYCEAGKERFRDFTPETISGKVDLYLKNLS